MIIISLPCLGLFKITNIKLAPQATKVNVNYRCFNRFSANLKNETSECFILFFQVLFYCTIAIFPILLYMLLLCSLIKPFCFGYTSQKYYETRQASRNIHFHIVGCIFPITT